MLIDKRGTRMVEKEAGAGGGEGLEGPHDLVHPTKLDQ
jgi:hypothetical protein